MTTVVATSPFTYAGQYRFAGEVFTLGGHVGDASLLSVGYVREYVSAADAAEVEDDEGRRFAAAAHLDAARAHQAQLETEERERSHARRVVDDQFARQEAALAEERRAHRGGVWQCPPTPALGGCGATIPVANIDEHIASHSGDARVTLAAAHSAEHARARSTVTR